MRLCRWIACLFASLLTCSLAVPAAAAPPDTYQVGVAKVDITPDYPIRLSGFGFRRTESEGVTQRIWAKALAIDDGEPAVLVTIDTCIIPYELTRELATRLEKKAKLRPERLAVTITHTHTAPMIKGTVPTLFGVPIPKEHQDHIDRYTAELLDKLEQVALAALADRKPAKLWWGIGSIDFAANRRSKGGPTDHDFPMLVVKDPQGKLRAIYVSYACHCVTLSNNKISGDWAGYAQEAIQDDFPGVIALVSIGCGADQNPNPGVTGDKAEIAQRQGAEVAKEVKRLLGMPLMPVTGRLTCASDTFTLDLNTRPAKAEWEERAKRSDAIGHHARVQLERLSRGEALKDGIDYHVQSWAFGDRLSIVFLAGEVVVDYSLRLKRELDGQRVWINAYSNGCPCYIPSERVLKEGGYEGGGAMAYYDLPAPLKPGLEDRIVANVREQLGDKFKSPFDANKTGGSRPLSPQQSLKLIQTKKDLTVELMAAEPLVTSPVAIDWGPDGRLYVAEMFDYPSGKQGDFQPGGRIRVLESTKRDWHYDNATIFLDDIPFPTGVTAYQKGVLVCAAPDLLYAEDTDGDGKADVVKKLYSGFGTHNYQGRVNSLEYGLDGWIYGSCGLFGGTITCRPLFPDRGKEHVVQLGDRDFRIKPDEGLLEPATGRTQQGRVRDDWGNWFGCDSGELCRHYPLMDHYLRRNPHYAATDTAVHVPVSQKLFPLNPQLQLFKLSGPPGVPTAACGLGIYRDDLLGEEYYGNAFVCEPVNLLVHRMRLLPKASTFVGVRADDEQQSEFLASTDNWFRPVQVRTGPDGCLWVVDMYRYVIEHPRWIPPEDLAKLDLRAGSTMGRIYRVRPNDKEPRPMQRLDKMQSAELVAALDSANGWQRDMAMMMPVWKNDVVSRSALEALVARSPRALTRMQALCTLGELGQLRKEVIDEAITDRAAAVRQHAVRLFEPHLAKDWRPGAAFLLLPADSDAQVRLQLASSLGQWPHRDSTLLLRDLLRAAPTDPYLTAAVMSSLNKHNLVGFAVLAAPTSGKDCPPQLMRDLLATAAGIDNGSELPGLLVYVTQTDDRRGFKPWQLAAVAGALDVLERQGKVWDKLSPDVKSVVAAVAAFARTVTEKEDAPAADLLAAVPLLGRDPAARGGDVAILLNLVNLKQAMGVQAAALAALARISDDAVALGLVRSWNTLSPTLKSQAIDLLLSRPAWQKQLVLGIEKKELPAAQIDAARRQRLLNHKDETIRMLAARVFDGAVNPDRQRVLVQFQDVATLKGDAARGKQLFAKTCSACHQLDGVGHDSGPNLAALQNKSAAYLLQEILDPNKNVDSRYVEYIALTKAGRTVTGLLRTETATSLTLRAQEGKEETLLRTDIEELKSSGKSLMPEGLEKDLSKQDLADLFAYLGQNGSPPGTNAVAQPGSPKQFAGNQPALVKPVNRRLDLLATNAEIYGGEIAFEEPFKNIGMWHGTDDRAVWTVQVDKAGEYDVHLDWACDDRSANNPFVLEGSKPLLRGKVPGTGGWDRYRQEKLGTIKLEAGRQRLTFRPDGVKPQWALCDLRGIHLVPKGEKLAK